MIYVMSDIHGNLKNFNSIMEQINLNESDTLYILGDVIDRYPDGIKILRKIMKMPNAKMLLGNHEYMMLNAIENCDEINASALELWYCNGGKCTHDYLIDIRKDIRKKIFDYLRSLPLNIDIEVGGQKYKLVHGFPKEYYKDSDLKYDSETEFAVWKRLKPYEFVPKDYILIFGHTPTRKYQNCNPLEVWFGKNIIGIDCGSGLPEIDFMDHFKGRLACIRLDDMKIYYSN